MIYSFAEGSHAFTRWEVLKSEIINVVESEALSHGSPAYFAGKQFVMLWPEGHHDHDFPHLWCAAPPGAQAHHITAEPDRFFRPPYVGGRGWLGVRLDRGLDWDEPADLCEQAFRSIAPRKLVAALDEAQRRD